MELLGNFLLDHVLLHVVIIDVVELHKIIFLEGLSCKISAVSWIINASLSMDHTINNKFHICVLSLSVLKILIEDISSLKVVSIIYQNFLSASWAEHSAVIGMNQTIELVNLNSILIPVVILIVPVINSSLEVFPFSFNLSSGGWIIRKTISGMDHAIKLTDLEDFSFFFSLLLSIVSLEHVIVDFFMINKVDILTVPLKINLSHG